MSRRSLTHISSTGSAELLVGAGAETMAAVTTEVV